MRRNPAAGAKGAGRRDSHPFHLPLLAIATCKSLTGFIPATVGRGQRVAIWAEKAKVPDSVILVVTIDVIELQRELLAAPMCEFAFGAAFSE